MKESQIRILENLAKYKYLNTSHMLQLGITTDQRYLYKVFPMIRDIKVPYVHRQKMPIEAVKGKVGDVYCLTLKGVRYLEEELFIDRERIRYPVGTPSVANRDYKHRMATIDIHIALAQFLESVGEEITNVSAYFDKPGSQRRGEPLILNKITISESRYLLPDLITRFTVGEGEKIIVWEQHNGKDTKKLLRQVETHIEALKGKLVGKKYGLNKLHRVGVIFEHKSILLATSKRLYELYGDSNDLHRCFIFKSNEQLQEDFRDGWRLWNGTTTTFVQ